MRQETAHQGQRGFDIRIVSMAAVATVAALIAAVLLVSYVNLLNEAVERGVRLRYAQQSDSVEVNARSASRALENSVTPFASASRQRTAAFARADR